MTDVDEALERIRPIVESVFEDASDAPRDDQVRLSEPTFGPAEVMEALESLLSTWVTMGRKVERFERKWSNYVTCDHAVMVNSGSTANLLALKALEGDIIEEGDEVIVPAVSWSTSVFPIIDCGAIPVFVDVDPTTYTMDPEAFNAAITDRTAAVIPVHLLGNPCEMEPIVDLCEDHDLAMVEDCCEAHGARYDGQPVGTFGDLGTFSFFFSHHISTIEGGAVVTDDAGLAERVTMMRAHGWIRELDDTVRQRYRRENPDIDERFLFARHGYNVRPTDIQGAFGMHQIGRLEGFVAKRRDTASELNERLRTFDDVFHLLEERSHTRCSWFAYPLLIDADASFTRDDLQAHLEERDIETRPMLAGDITRQPAFDSLPHRISGELSTATEIHRNGLFIGNHHRITAAHIDHIEGAIRSFLDEV